MTFWARSIRINLFLYPALRHPIRHMIDINELYLQLGRNIKAARKNVKLSQEDLASILDLERTSISNIEQGKQKPPLHVVYKLSVIFELALSDLLPPLNGVCIDQELLVTFGSHSHKVPRKTAEAINRYTNTESV